MKGIDNIPVTGHVYRYTYNVLPILWLRFIRNVLYFDALVLSCPAFRILMLLLKFGLQIPHSGSRKVYKVVQELYCANAITRSKSRYEDVNRY
jgi:hypothetical protein